MCSELKLCLRTSWDQGHWAWAYKSLTSLSKNDLLACLELRLCPLVFTSTVRNRKRMDNCSWKEFSAALTRTKMKSMKIHNFPLVKVWPQICAWYRGSRMHGNAPETMYEVSFWNPVQASGNAEPQQHFCSASCGFRKKLRKIEAFPLWLIANLCYSWGLPMEYECLGFYRSSRWKENTVQ